MSALVYCSDMETRGRSTWPMAGHFLGWASVAATGYAALSFFAHRSVYFPMKHPEGYWHVQEKLGAQDVWLTTRDGVKLHGWWLRSEGSALATLFLHGNAGNVTHRFETMERIAEAGSSVLVIDYRGYGKSEGRPTESGLYTDAAAGYDWLAARGYRPEQIVLHGESLGTAVAVELAARRGSRGLVLEAPFTSARDVASGVLPLIGPALISGFDSARRIRSVRVPLLVIHGDRDDIIDPALGRRLFALANEPKTLWVVTGAGHNDLVPAAGPEYIRRLAAFYSAPR